MKNDRMAQKAINELLILKFIINNKIIEDIRNTIKSDYRWEKTDPDYLVEFVHAYAFLIAISETEEEYKQRGRSAVKALRLDDRSLVFSKADVRTNRGTFLFLIPGICDYNSLLSYDPYRKRMKRNKPTEVNVKLSSYSVGKGKQKLPDGGDLKLINQYWDEIEEKYKLDLVSSFEFKSEE